MRRVPIKLLFVLFAAGFWLTPMAMSPTPSDFIIKYHWVAGSMPPPYHYEYSVEITSEGEGTIDFFPDYPGMGSPHWKRSFTLPLETVVALYRQLAHAGAFSDNWESRDEKIIGGTLEWMSGRIEGDAFSIPSSTSDPRAKEVFKLFKPIIPTSIMKKLMSLRDKYQEDYSENGS